MPEVPIVEARAALERRAGELGFAADDAALLADHFLDAELRGEHGHGLGRMRWVAGLPDLDPGARPALEERREGLARYAGRGAIGYVALARALEAEAAAPPAGARVVAVAGCFPTGRLGYFAEAVARRGLLCLLTATSTPRLVHPDGGPPALGTNPLCLALPRAPHAVVVDVSMGRVTYGAVLAAAAEGRPLPPGAAARHDGAAEHDPSAVVADRAGIVAFGGEQSHKGFALAFLAELLVGALAGVEGHGAVALLVRPAGDPLAPVLERVGERRLPGERSRAALEEALRRGTVDVEEELWSWLRR